MHISQSSVQHSDRIVRPRPGNLNWRPTLATHVSTPLRPQNHHPGHSLQPRLQSRARYVATWPCRAPAGKLRNKSSTWFHVLIQLFIDGGGSRHEQKQSPNSASKAGALCKNLVCFRIAAPEYGDVRPNRHWSNLLTITPGRNITSFTESSFQEEASARCSCTKYRL